MKIKTQLEVIKECKRVPRIDPPAPEFAELINMCMKVGLMSSSDFVGDRDFNPKVSYWTELKEKYMNCLLYTSPSPRDGLLSRMPSSA